MSRAVPCITASVPRARRFWLLALLIATGSAPSFAELEGTKVRIFLCDTEAAAVTFARARTAPRTTDDLAANIVNKGEKRIACNRYIGYVGKETEHRKVVDGYLFKLTRYKLIFADNRPASEAWGAERLFDADTRYLPRDL